MARTFQLAEAERRIERLETINADLFAALEQIKTESCCAAETFDENLRKNRGQSTMNDLLSINQLARAAILAAKIPA